MRNFLCQELASKVGVRVILVHTHCWVFQVLFTPNKVSNFTQKNGCGSRSGDYGVTTGRLTSELQRLVPRLDRVAHELPEPLVLRVDVAVPVLLQERRHREATSSPQEEEDITLFKRADLEFLLIIFLSLQMCENKCLSFSFQCEI